MQQGGWSFWRDESRRGGLLCYVPGHFDWLLFNYILVHIWLDLLRRRFSVGLKLDWIAHRRIGQLLIVIVICVWIFFPPRINFFTYALIVRQF